MFQLDHFRNKAMMHLEDIQSLCVPLGPLVPLLTTHSVTQQNDFCLANGGTVVRLCFLELLSNQIVWKAPEKSKSPPLIVLALYMWSLKQEDKFWSCGSKRTAVDLQSYIKIKLHLCVNGTVYLQVDSSANFTWNVLCQLAWFLISFNLQILDSDFKIVFIFLYLFLKF